MSADRSFADMYPSLSQPPDAAGLSRRRFLQGVLAAAGTSLAARTVGGWRPAGAAGSETVLITVMLGGGNDGLNTLVPHGDPRYAALRGALAIAPSDVLGIDDAQGLHPSLRGLKARYDAGTLAVIRGVGLSAEQLSHSAAMGTVMAGSSNGSFGSGWLGRWADGLTDGSPDLALCTMTSTVPLHLVGTRTTATTVPGTADLFGAETVQPTEVAVQQTAAAFATDPSTAGVWRARFAAAGRDAIALAGRFASPLSQPVQGGELERQLVLAAHLVNAGLGIRVLNVARNGYDTHDDQHGMHAWLLAELDTAIESFYATVDPARAPHVAILTFSEFGRRAQANSSYGTDHGAASTWLLVGDRVRGGLHGDAPSLAADALDSVGNLRPTTDFRSIYAATIGSWLGGDATSVLGGSYPTLDLFAPPG